MHKILSIDGGGIRGIIPIRILERLNVENPGFSSKFDLYAGTSTGGVIAAGLADGMTPSFLLDMYVDLSNDVFYDTVFDDIKDWGMLLGAQYSSDALNRLLSENMGDKRLGDLKKNVLISAFDLYDAEKEHWKPKFFHNYPDGDLSESIVDVVCRTAAAPMYFPIYQGYIDGGVVANNPSMCALAQALHEGIHLDQIAVLSLGTGLNPMSIRSENGDWGALHWIPEILHIIMDGSVGLADYQCGHLLGSHYLRANPKLFRSIPLDGIKDIEELLFVGDRYNIGPILDWFDEL